MLYGDRIDTANFLQKQIKLVYKHTQLQEPIRNNFVAIFFRRKLESTARLPMYGASRDFPVMLKQLSSKLLGTGSKPTSAKP